jgi:uncharacterized Zn finger protein (UPF0148 family)
MDDPIPSLTCPHDGVLLRDDDGAISCPECGYAIPAPRVEMPPEFDGPDLDERRWPV